MSQSVQLPEAPCGHLFVPRGSVALEGAGPLTAGDAVRFTATGGQQVTATSRPRSSSGKCTPPWANQGLAATAHSPVTGAPGLRPLGDAEGSVRLSSSLV